MKAIAIYPEEVTFLVDLPVEAQGSAMDALHYLHQVLRVRSSEEYGRGLSRVAMVGAQVRPCGPGDVFIVFDRIFLLDNEGWFELDNAQLIELHRYSGFQRQRGYAYLHEHCSFSRATGYYPHQAEALHCVHVAV